jgi:hypothetical protein
MANFPVGTRVQDPATGWTGTVVNYSSLTTTQTQAMALWQNTQPNFPANYNSTLILVQWDYPDGSGDKIPNSVFVANSSVVAL